MRITKKLEKEIQALMDDYWGSYLKGDLQTWASYLPDDYRNIGTTQAELWDSKKEMVEFTEMVLDQMVGMAEARNKKTQIIPYDPYIMVHELSDLYVKAEEGWIFYAQIRMSSLLGKTPDGWKVLHQHGSYPDSKTEEGETFAFSEMKAENKKLRDAIKSRTIELEQKNRELEIETAVERVRATSLAMHHTSEIQEVIHTVHEELLKLNISIQGGSFIVINDDIDTELLCWGAGGTANTSELIHVPHFGKPFCTNLINGIKQGPGFFTEEFTQNEKKEYFSELFKHHPWTELDSKQKKETLNSEGGYARSCCVAKHTSIFIINQLGRKFSDGENEILKRFSKVFEQTYTRFLDLQKAEAQARKAQIEAALERVRARTMAMHKSDELLETGALLFRELSKLGVKIFNCGYVLMDDKKNVGWNYGVNPGDGTIRPLPTGIPQTGTKVLDHITESWKKQEPCLIIELGPQETIAHQTYMAENLLNFSLTKEKLLALSPERLAIHTFNFKHGYLLLVDGVKLTADQQEMVRRFAHVFEQTYIRFLDLQKAEAQTREAQIEAALERVRSITMAMHKSEELPGVANRMFVEIQSLGIPVWSTAFNIFSKDKASVTCNVSSEGQLQPSFNLPLTEEQSFREWHDAIERKETFFVQELGGKDLEQHYQYLFTLPGVKDAAKPLEDEGIALPTFQVNHVCPFNHGFLLFITHEKAPDAYPVFRRFASVFEQTYTRFLDLQKAEAQAREAQIEAALERVRARSMAMHKSEELAETASLLFKQIGDLGLDVWSSGFQIWNADDISTTAWMYTVGGEIQAGLRLPHTEDPYFQNIYDARHNADGFFVMESKGKELEKTYRYMFNIPEWKKAFGDIEASGFPVPKYQITHCAFFPQGYLMLITHKSYPEYWDIFKRFGKVFEQTYTRFLDLQKAEAQAREAQIEAALERVRSRSLAMHKTDELQEVVRVVAEELKHTGVILDTWGAVICTYFQDSKDVLHWTAAEDPANPSIAFLLPYFKDELYDEAWASKNRGDSYFAKVFSFEVKNAFFRHAFEHSDYRLLPDDYKKTILGSESHGIAWAWAKNSAIMIPSIQGELPSDEEKEILIRFAKVFEQSFIRFLDIQKAEAQVREAQIETALERIRSQATSMQQSTDLLDVVVTMRNEFIRLGHEAHYFWHMLWSPDKYEKAMTSGDGTRIGFVMELPRHIHGNIPLLAEWEKSDAPTAVYPMDVDAALDYVHKMISLGDFKNIDPNAPSDDDIRHIGGLTFIMARTTHGEIGYSLPGAVVNPPAEDLEILVRFAGAFDLAHRRFLDLQQSEALARETQIELALEKVRNRTMAMQHSDELPEAANHLFLEIQALGLPAASAGYCIWENEDKKSATAFVSSIGELQKPFSLPTKGIGYDFYNPMLNGEKFLVEELHGQRECAKHYAFMRTLPVFGEVLDGLFEAGFQIPDFQVFHIVYFSQGYLMFITREPVPHAYDIFKRCGNVFEQTYTRFLDLQTKEEQALKLAEEKQRLEKTLHDLRVTQAQLIQSEKLASLGELTAGIAHEIQNPLNFVNNFSELSVDLAKELNEEIDKEPLDKEFVKELIGDLTQNQEKINHHGKRAASIVTGMLQHSRASTGKKETTDLNALADEYLRLSFHGLRAKDSSFNAQLVTDFDPDIGLVEVIPQDIGRVFLNIINNAFFATQQRKAAGQDFGSLEPYVPTVSVSSKRTDSGVEFRIRDNGTGVPDDVKAKIFQPFFTTKPTGQGTGLGLSLSYDIVKAHGGKLEFETQADTGTTFLIELPVKS